MATTVVPQKYMHKCDRCGAVETNASSSRPTYWVDLIVAQDAYDFQGAAVADGTIKRLLCGECKTVVISAINAAVATS